MLYDIQVNGAFGVDFNDDALTLDAFQFACSHMQATGVKHFFPTIITAPVAIMGARIQKIVDFLESDASLRSLVAGLHVEGPFLSSIAGYRGTHPENAILVAELGIAQRLLDSGNGLIRLVTLAPEMDPGFHVTSFLAQQGIVVFAGHTDASMDCLLGAIDHGLRGFTHLGNGCSLQIHRHDNIISRVLSLRTQLYVSLIADGVHLPFWLLRLFFDIIGNERVILTSDSMSAAGMPPGEYCIGGQPIIVDADRRTRHRDHNYLAGSASTLAEMQSKCRHWLPESPCQEEQVFWKNAFSLFKPND